jgi:glycosyltransferase involved in cell wall biosynthesis
MKVAIVHDYIKEYGGAERVLETLLEIYPDADVYTSLYAPEFLGPHRARFEKYKIKTTFINNIPLRHKLISPLRLLSPVAFSSLDLSAYDVIIISQTGAYFPNLIKKKSALQICYTHTPPRYLYGYATARDWKKHKLIAAMANFANYFLKKIDYRASRNVDFFIANSEEIASRIKKFYRRDAIIIYPPVYISSQGLVVSGRKKDYYLTGGRLARAKGIDVIVKAFNSNGLPLKIFGKGFAGFEEELRGIAKENIEFVGEVSDDEKFELMKNAKAFIFASFDEDFGITPVEAMGVGTAVIAYKSGGVKETVIEGRTGLFFDENSPDALSRAIDGFEKTRIDTKDCINQAKKFSKENFIKNIKEFVNSKIE